MTESKANSARVFALAWSFETLVPLLVIAYLPLLLDGKQAVQMRLRTGEYVAESVEGTKDRVEVTHNHGFIIIMLGDRGEDQDKCR